MNEIVEQDLALFPAWRQAVRDFLAEFKYGDLVPHSWLEQRFGMPSLRDSQQLTAQEFANRQFAWLSNIESFKAELLRDHQVCLASVRGEGFRWVPPQEQTRLATTIFEREARKAFASAGQRLKNLRADELSDEQRRENVDAVAKIASLRRMSRKALEAK